MTDALKALETAYNEVLEADGLNMQEAIELHKQANELGYTFASDTNYNIVLTPIYCSSANC